MTDGGSDDDWVRETLARAVLEGGTPPPTPAPPPAHRAAAADVGTAPAGTPAFPSGPAPVAPDERTGAVPAEPGPAAGRADAWADQPPPERTLGAVVGEPPDGPGSDGDDAAPGDPSHGATSGLAVGSDDDAAVDLDDDAGTGHSAVRSVVEWVVVVVGALAAALVLRALLLQAFWIPSESMEPTLQRDDRVLVNRLSYRLHDVNRGDIVVFGRPPSEPEGPIHDLIKRVVGLEGETVEARGGQIYIDGRQLLEGYLAEGPPIADFGPVVVPEGHVFVMGDNRNNSRDSRFFSAIDEDSIVGRAFVRFWPLDRLGLL